MRTLQSADGYSSITSETEGGRKRSLLSELQNSRAAFLLQSDSIRRSKRIRSYEIMPPNPL